MVGSGGRGGGQAWAVCAGGPHEAVSVGGANLPATLRGSLVDGHSLDRFSALGLAQGSRADLESQIHPLRNLAGSQKHAGAALRFCLDRLALCGRVATG
ncbi:hypothetical protein D3C75_1061220 [compost metagenome]